MDYKAEAEKRLSQRRSIFEQRKSVTEDANLSDAEKRTRVEKMDADMDSLFAEAEQFVKDGERAASIADVERRAGRLTDATRHAGGPSDDDDNAPNFADQLRAVGLGELRSLDFAPEADAYRAFEGRTLPTNVIESVSNGAADNKLGVAGTVTPTTFVAQLLESMIDYSDILNRIKQFSTSGGEVMNWPRRVSRVGSTFQHVLEAANYPSVVDGNFSLFPLSAHKFGAIAELPEEALTDPAIDIAGIVADEMGADLAESLSSEVMSGSILSQNILSSVIHSTTLPEPSATDTTHFDKLLAIQHSIRMKYRPNASWTISDDYALKLRGIKDAQNRYIWQPAIIAGQPDLLLGKPVSTDVLMPAVALSDKSVLYGDFQRFYILRNVRQVNIKRSDEFGFGRDTVALKITWRGDGGVTDPEAMAVGVFPAT